MATPLVISPPGSIHQLSFRTTTGQFWFRPDELTTQNFIYLLGYAEGATNVVHHLVTLLSNHGHSLLTDVEGDRLPEYNTRFFSLLSRSTNALRGRRGNLLDPEGVNDVMVAPFAEDLIARGCYVSMQAVAAELVSHAKKWPGVCVRPCEMGRLQLTAKRSETFYDPEGELPESMTATFAIPKVLDCSQEELRQLMSEEHNRQEHDKREEMARSGKSFAGRKKILRQLPTTSPKQDPPLFERKPHIACKNTPLRISMLEWRRRRNQQYRMVLDQVRSGEKHVTFPIGTWVMHFRLGFDRAPWTECIWSALLAAEP